MPQPLNKTESKGVREVLDLDLGQASPEGSGVYSTMSRLAQGPTAASRIYELEAALLRKLIVPWLIGLGILWGTLVGEGSSPETGTNVFESCAAPAPQNQLDKLVFAELARLDIHPMLCSDAVFVRRAYLDVIGTVPTAKEARDFIEDERKDKRSALIDHLLQREDFADYWSMKWGDVLRIKA